jgi:hypothetical protein
MDTTETERFSTVVSQLIIAVLPNTIAICDDFLFKETTCIVTAVFPTVVVRAMPFQNKILAIPTGFSFHFHPLFY